MLGNQKNVAQQNFMAFRKFDAIITKCFTKLEARMYDMYLNICL